MRGVRCFCSVSGQNTKLPSTDLPSMDTLTSLCKQRGFIFPSSEIYNSISGFFDYGHLGVELKNNIKKVWWQDMVYRRGDMIGMESSIISAPAVWAASGHIDQFSDPFVDCKESKMRFRADQVHWAPVELAEGCDIGGDPLLGYICIAETHLRGASKQKKKSNSGVGEDIAEALTSAAANVAKRLLKQRLAVLNKSSDSISVPLRPITLRDLTTAPLELLPRLPSPATGTVGTLTPPRQFNLMFQTRVGAVIDDSFESHDVSSAVTYLRPETAQGIFVNFQNMQRASRLKLPFGIAQVGKAFRNEITPRNFIFRSREFEMMEIEYFISPDEDIWRTHLSEWLQVSWDWLVRLGLQERLLSKKEHMRNDDGSGLAHYAKACTDIEFQFPFGRSELMGVAARGSYDLSQHAQHSGKSMDYSEVSAGDSTVSRKYVPHVIEPSIGLDRLVLALLTSAYREEEVDGEKRVVLALHPAIAPVKACVLPLLKNNPELMRMAQDVFDALKESGQWNIEMDTAGTIGKRYRRADEIGTPFCLTVDVDSLQDKCVTLRHRDSMKQERVPVDALRDTLERYLRWR